MKKLNDFEKKDKESLEDQISIGAKKIGVSDAFYDSPKSGFTTADLGLCRKCKWIRVFKQQYGSEHASCLEMDNKLNPEDPIINCSEYLDRTSMSLRDMQSIAVIIELNDKTIGF